MESLCRDIFVLGETTPSTLIDISLEAVTDSSDDILQAIESNGGSLPLGDKSTPEEIQEHFGISKKNFKRVLGGLYKAGKIEIFDHEVRLKMAEG